MPVRFTPVTASDIHSPTPVIYDPGLELFMSVTEQRYSFNLGHKKIKGSRWMSIGDDMPSNITGHPIGGVDYIIKRIAVASNEINGSAIFKLFDNDVEIYSFELVSQTHIHIENIDLQVPGALDFGMQIITENNNYISYPAVSVFARRTYEEAPIV
jgi:hypothetical protein